MSKAKATSKPKTKKPRNKKKAEEPATVVINPSAVVDVLTSAPIPKPEIPPNATDAEKAKLLDEWERKDERVARRQREAWKEQMKETNGKATNGLKYVVKGDPDLDPEMVETEKARQEVLDKQKAERNGKFKTFLETKAAEKASQLAKEIKPKKDKPSIFGQPAPAVCRLMGWLKLSKEQADKAVKSFGLEIGMSSLQTYLSDGKREDERYGKRAVVTKEQEAELLAFKV